MCEARLAWSARIDEADDLPELDFLESELIMLTEAWVGPLRLKIINRKRQMRQQARQPAAQKPHAPGARFGLPPADGRWLYAYRIDDDVFQQLHEHLASRPDIQALASGDNPALFVLWSSEWFRRSYCGGGQSWNGLLGDLGMQSDGQVGQGTMREIARRGLRAWKRPVIHIGSHQFLGTLAREGGFPAAAVKTGASGWANRVLSAIVGALLGNPAADEDTARSLAEEARSWLPQTFNDDDFVQLCADFAYSIVTIRRAAEPKAIAAGLTVANWLDLNRPGWRRALPLSIGDNAADRLVDNLLAVEAVTGAFVGTERLLQLDSAVWHEALRIRLDGPIESKATAQIDPAFGRLRAFASGDLARHIPGELALFEPPAVGEKQWSVRSVRTAQGVHRVPFSASLELDLRSGERRVGRIALPSGKPRRGQLLIAEREEGEELTPSRLRVIGTGSGQVRAEVVYLQAPANWLVTATAGEEARSLGPGVGDSQLWLVKGGAFVTDDSGDRFRIRCNQAADHTQRMDLIGTICSWAEVQNSVDLYVGAPHVRTGADGGQLLIRDPGTRHWRKAPRVLPVGQFELGWRMDNILLDRRRIAVLPASAALTRSGMGSNLQYDLAGFGDAEIVPDSDAPVRICADGGQWHALTAKAAVNRFGATIRFPDGPDLAVTIAFPCPAGLAQWNGSLLPTAKSLTLADLPDFVAIDGGNMELVAELSEPGRPHLAELSWQFDREFPLASIRTELAGLLMPAGIEAWISLSMHDGLQNFWKVRPFELAIDWRDGKLTTDLGVIDEAAHLYGRPMADPCREVDFGSYNLLSDSNHRPVSFPDDVGGPWLIYLRAGERVLTRPRCLPLPGTPTEAETSLGKVMAIGDFKTMLAAVEAWLDDAASTGDLEAIHQLNALVATLDGLPPATFKVLELLPRFPSVLTRMALNARPDQRDAVMRLSRDLPFAWFMLSAESWNCAGDEHFRRMADMLATLDNPMEKAFQAVGITQRALVQHEPLLGQIFNSDAPGTIADVAQRFLNRSSHRIRGASYGRYRRKLADLLPGYFITQGFSEHFIDTLDAPCAAALAAKGHWQPDAEAVRHIKTAAHNFPNYFAEAFAVWLKESA